MHHFYSSAAAFPASSSPLPAGRLPCIFHLNMSTTNCRPAPLPESPRAGTRTSALSLLLVAALAAGCAHSSKNAAYSAAAQPPPSQPPVFLSGPMALLFTNAHGFRARVQLEEGLTGSHVTTGELIGRGGNLLFLPTVDKAARKRSLAADSAFIWDVPAHRGSIINGSMQAYAPIPSTRLFTNIVVSAADSAPTERIAGHPCQRVEAVVTANDGSLTAFRLWRATDLEGLPLRVICTSSSTPLTLTLTKPRLETPPDDLFLPPAGFTKFDSAPALVGELTARQQNLKRQPADQPDANQPFLELDSRAPTRP